MNQSKIDAAAALRVGFTASERSKNPNYTVKREDVRRTISQLAVTCLQANEDFYKFLETLFPALGSTTKEAPIPEAVREVDHCCGVHLVTKMSISTPGQAQNIQQTFAQNYPAQWAQLNSYATSWLDRLMSGNLPNQGAPFNAAYWAMIQMGASWGYQTMLPKWPNELPPMPFVVSAGEDFIKKIYTDGYGLVSSQITQNVLPQAMNSINTALSQGKNYNEITAELKKQYGETSYHWLRLVRSEMAMAANAGTMAQARELNEPTTVIKWSTSGGSACPICAPRNGKLYALNAPELQQLIPHPNCRCVRIITFKKQPV